jgi:hypothetical protein
MLNIKKRELLKNYNWEDVYPKLIAFAEWVIQDKYWNSNILPKGQTAESIVRDAIAKTFTEERNWDPERGDLFMWLRWVIRSDISHLAESSANKAEVHLDINDRDEDFYFTDGNSTHLLSKYEMHVDSPEMNILAIETEAEKSSISSAKINAILTACSGKPELEEIVIAIIDGKCSAKPQDLAEYLGRPVTVIYQDIRALRRRANKIKSEVSNER